MNYVVISMYTADTPYEREAEKLRASLVNSGVKHHIYAVENTGSWVKNCQQKAVVIRRAMDQFEENIVWIDADAVLNARPTLFEDLECDLAYHFLKCRRELLSGTLWIGNNPRMRSLVDEWIDLNSTNSAWDQKNLQRLVESAQDLRVTRLPAAYCKIFDLRAQGAGTPVITHYQASRRFRNSMCKYVPGPQ